ncbi:MAG: hypothetical protein EOM67_08520 [Spirochaetia bacterium]|nr:hypothetical protein [Spirochaetia bacterium]
MEEDVRQLDNKKVLLSCTLIMYEACQKASLERYTNSHKDYLQLTETINSLRIESCYACKRPFDFTDGEKLQRGIELKKAIKLRRKAARKQQKNSIQYRKRSAEVEKLLMDKNEAIALYEKSNNEAKFQRTILNGYNIRYNDFVLPERPTEEHLQLEAEFKTLKCGNLQELEQELNSLSYTEVEDAVSLYNECKASISSLESVLKFLSTGLKRALELETKVNEETQKLKLLESTKKALKAYSDVQTNSIAPDLATKSTSLMNLLLDKYDSITISEDLQADVYSDGVLIPLLSGGEEDIISLCLRIALSEMISERTGNTLSLLILDEVFSAMDKDKRVLAMDAISNLKSKFPQIIVISHIDEIQEMADNQIRL